MIKAICYEKNEDTIDLNGIKDDVFIKKIKIISEKNNGKQIPFFTEIISSDSIKINKKGNDIELLIETPNICQNEFITFKNSEGERTKITIIPNDYFIMEKTYKFKITKKVINEDKTISIKILSKVNNDEIGWKCTHTGQPISYSIKPLFGKESGIVTIACKGKIEVYNDFYTLIKFTQNESNNTVTLKINYSRDGMSLEVN